MDIEVSVRDGKMTDFYFSIGDYYRIPILFLIVKEARVEPNLVIKLRRDGYRWYEIMLKFGSKP
ncbi:hypothetical protein QI155_07775 [Thermodesulfovibrio sp. 1176]|uniref:hypothetical protein n=1 Tax=Thermodesulfovibrio sp. 1176 TaxID=3043424 RepID=UPI002482E0CE|nr:hypothetical protein [Thermodesulfovibrio sp. 1176]MDI1472432.1 hypothetical protein [Thermodesulfovibrio sp. 1176]